MGAAWCPPHLSTSHHISLSSAYFFSSPPPPCAATAMATGVFYCCGGGDGGGGVVGAARCSRSFLSLSHPSLIRRRRRFPLVRLLRRLLLLVMVVAGLLSRLGACCSAISHPPFPIRVLPLPYQAAPIAPRWTAETGMELGGVCVRVCAVSFLYDTRSNCRIAMCRGQRAEGSWWLILRLYLFVARYITEASNYFYILVAVL